LGGGGGPPRTRDGGGEARVEAVGAAEARVSQRDQGQPEHVAFNAIIPHLNVAEIRRELAGTAFDLSTEIKRRSLATVTGAARKRAETTQLTVSALAERIFPLRVVNVALALSAEPVRLDAASGLAARMLAEPLVEFGR